MVTEIDFDQLCVSIKQLLAEKIHLVLCYSSIPWLCAQQLMIFATNLENKYQLF